MTFTTLAARTMALSAFLALAACTSNACMPVSGTVPTIPERPIPANPDAQKGMTFSPSAGGV